MRHAGALMLVVALLAKRPDTLYVHLLLQESSGISQVYADTPQRTRFRMSGT